MLLEVEPSEGQMRRRRIGFYERNGFYLKHYPLSNALPAGGRPQSAAAAHVET